MLDIIGTMYTPGTIDALGNQITPPVALPGWHVNSPQPMPGWEAYQVEPATPYRVFAGHPAWFYVFPDKAAFEAIVNPPPAPAPGDDE